MHARFSAIATDPLDFSRSLRLELGLAPDLHEDDRFPVGATVIDGEKMFDLLALAACNDAQIVMMNIRVPFKMDAPAEMQVYRRVGTGVMARMGAALWDRIGSAAAILLTDHDGSNVAAFATDSLIPLPGLPLGLKASPGFGIDRAMQRISDRMLMIGNLPAIMPLAA